MNQSYLERLQRQRKGDAFHARKDKTEEMPVIKYVDWAYIIWDHHGVKYQLETIYLPS